MLRRFWVRLASLRVRAWVRPVMSIRPLLVCASTLAMSVASSFLILGFLYRVTRACAAAVSIALSRSSRMVQ